MDANLRRVAVISGHLGVIGEDCGLSSVGCNATGDSKDKISFYRDQIRWGYYLIGALTIRDGTAVAFTNRWGNTWIEEGPKWRFMLNQSYALLPNIIAGPREYLEIKNIDGTTDHVEGPTSLHFDVSKFQSVTVRPQTTVAAGYAVVIYEKTGDEINKRIVYGPSSFTLRPSEWLHTFFWNVPDQTDPTMKNRKLMRFKKLRVIPDQLYFDIEDVRTKDDAVLTIKLMVFYHLSDIMKMLNGSHDPVTELLNTITADIIDFASARNFEAFKQDTELLNRIDTYHQSLSRSTGIGYTLTKVVYRGYGASFNLQQMHNDAIEKRTQLKLQKEQEEQEQDIEDLKLARQQHRKKSQMELDEEQVLNEQKLQRIQHEERIRQTMEDSKSRIQMQKEEHELEKTKLLEKLKVEEHHQQAMEDMKLKFLKSLDDINVDVTQYLVSGFQRPDKLIQILGKKERDEDKDMNVHLHQSID
eukprot:CAMPEP_0174269522 /NCGR_PEP_ID=MMETSP0439-20130205/41346_1 /TAXON_ID=0 /ORGANISM="Stereomyxa ramosa, Strain Chinc5" /LENGTH=470 /DNA_ID=CAMNT_0015358355 /DNA_START=363 /DNA_END=1775 /DNA_ORIENTATION=-